MKVFCMNLKGNIELLLSASAILISIISIAISIALSHKQNKITLIQKRFEIFDRIEMYVQNIDSWEFKYDWFANLNLSKIQIRALFDTDFLNFYELLAKSSQQIDMLWGDYKYAIEHGTCHNKNEEMIESEIINITENITMDFNKLKDHVYIKFFKL